MTFCRSFDTMAGSIKPAEFPRLLDMGCHPKAGVAYRVSGGANERGFPSLHIEIQGEFVMVCQRCLEPMTWSMSSTVDLELAMSREAADSAEDERERVVASKTMDVVSLVEDEIILEAPMIPRHVGCSASAAPGMPASKSPFGALVGLRHLRRG
jgi:uncharacterized protein